MSPTIRVLAVSALVLGLTPALAAACEDDAAKAAVVKIKSSVKVITCVKSTVTQTTTCTKTVNATRRSGWSPGHLIEPDSMRLGPGDELDVPNTEQWVILSSRAGTIHFRHYPPGSKKTEGRALQQHGPYRG